jgi:predicted  nucleic acid-binding Zn-ribbon protein
MSQVTATSLRTLHRILRQLADLNERLEKGPRQIAARKARVTQLEDDLAKANAALKARKVASDQKQLQLRTGEQRIADLTKKLNACKSNREYQALKEQIAADEMANSVLADEILEGMEGVDSVEGGVAEAKRAVENGKQELAKAEQTVAGEREGLQSEVARLKAELEQAEKLLPADFIEDYRRVVRSKGEDAMAEVTDGAYCGGCHRQLLPNQIAQVGTGATTICKPCGRLLYMPEDRTMAS